MDIACNFCVFAVTNALANSGTNPEDAEGTKKDSTRLMKNNAKEMMRDHLPPGCCGGTSCGWSIIGIMKEVTNTNSFSERDVRLMEKVKCYVSTYYTNCP